MRKNQSRFERTRLGKRASDRAVFVPARTVVVDGIGCQHAEDWRLDRVLHVHRRRKRVLARGIVCAVGISAAKTVGVGRVLFAADAESVHAIPPSQVVHRVRVEKPAADRLRVVAERILEKTKHLVADALALRRRIAHREAGVDKPFPIPARPPTPRDANLFDKLAAHFKPDAVFGLVLFRALGGMHDVIPKQRVVL